MTPQILFDKSAKEEVLELLDKAIDTEKYIVEKDNPKQRVLTVDGEEISLEEFGGIQKGSEVFIKNNLVSLIRLAKRWITLGFLEKLKDFVKLEFNINAPIIDNTKVILIKDSFKKNSENKQPDKKTNTDKIVQINLEKIDNKQREKLKLLLQEYLENGNKLLQTDTANLLEKLYNYNKENDDKQILQFFNGIIPPQDLEALEASLYLRSVFRKHEDVQSLKSDIRLSFGIRGNNIANLCTAGYFEEFLIPLYNASKEKFKELYELIVGKSVLAVFVHQGTNTKVIQEEIEEKINASKKYGLKFLHIHGIGKNNVKKIKEYLSEKKEFFEFFEKKEFEKDNIIIIELLLK